MKTSVGTFKRVVKKRKAKVKRPADRETFSGSQAYFLNVLLYLLIF